MNARVGAPADSEGHPPAALRFGHRFCCAPHAGAAQFCARFDVAIFADAAWCVAGEAGAGLRAGARFLIDAAYGRVAPTDLARMIGAFAFACNAETATRTLDVTLRNDRSLITAARVHRAAFAVESNTYGAAHILYENAALGLYVLELAPGASIPAHFHRVMEESELVLDDGLLQQGSPVRAGDAFAWPGGCVHGYRNPTDAPKRVLCLDRPKFIPEDEVVFEDGPEPAPVAPRCNYLV